MTKQTTRFLIATGVLAVAILGMWQFTGSKDDGLPQAAVSEPSAVNAGSPSLGGPRDSEVARESEATERAPVVGAPSSLPGGAEVVESGDWPALAEVFEHQGRPVTRSLLGSLSLEEHEALRREFRAFSREVEVELLGLHQDAEVLTREDAQVQFEEAPELYFARTSMRNAEGKIETGYVEVSGLAPDLLREVKELSLELLTHPSLAFQDEEVLSKIVTWEPSLHGAKVVGRDAFGRAVVNRTLGWAGAPVF